MHELSLTGLYGTHPLGALASFGLLRVLARRGEFSQLRLGWNPAGGMHAVLYHDSPLEKEHLLDALLDHMRGRSEAPFLARDDIKLKPEEFRAFRQQATESSDPEALEFFAAFGSEIVCARSTGDVKPTAFHLTAGQQKFLKSAREMAQTLDPNCKQKRTLASPREAFEQTLFGPWTYQDPVHSLGWDPGTEALHALSDRAPTDAGPVSQRGAVWLAFEALPLFPCVPRQHSGGSIYLHTRGFNREATAFRWPLWAAPGITLQTLLELAALGEIYLPAPDAIKLLARGIVAVYESACHRDGNGRGTLRHARAVWTAIQPTAEVGS